jgi:predicted nucleic acid-binding protein
MNKLFVDSNICVYAFDQKDSLKRKKAESILQQSPCLSSQVIIETQLACKGKLKLPDFVCDENTHILCSISNIVAVTAETFLRALGVKYKYKFSFLDSIIVATAIEADCTVLYSEDLQHNQVIDNKLTIVNPFIG